MDLFPLVVEFFGPWCRACKSLYPKFMTLAYEHPEVLFLKVNIDENQDLAVR